MRSSPAGPNRLDAETSGLLVFTTDGRLVRHVADPTAGGKLLKTYRCLCHKVDDAAVAAPEPTHADTPMPMTFEEYWNTRGSMVHSAITRGHDQTSEAGGDGGVVGGSR